MHLRPTSLRCLGKGKLGTLCWRDGIFASIDDAKNLAPAAAAASAASPESSASAAASPKSAVSALPTTVLTASTLSELSMTLVLHLWLLKQSGLLKTAETLAAKAECCFTIVSSASGPSKSMPFSSHVCTLVSASHRYLTFAPTLLVDRFSLFDRRDGARR